MSLPKLVTLLEAGERGALADLQWFYHYMERSDAMIHGVIQRRRAALMGCDWDIRLCPPKVGEARIQNSEARIQKKTSDQVLAEEQAAFLREAYDRVENFRDAVSFLFSGVFRGYAHLEKQFESSGLVSRLEPVDQWFWVRDGMYGAWEYNQNAVSGRRRGVPIELEDFVVVETVAINRMLAVLYLRKNLSQKDWDSFLEVYGIPSVFLVGPANVPESKEADYQKIAQDIISDGRGYLPFGSDVKYVNGGGNRPPFMEHIEYIDRQITLAATGGLLTMLTQSGSGTLAGGAHQETFLQIARGDAAMLSGIFQEQFDTPLLRQFFPDEPILAYFEFVPPAADEVSRVIQDAVELTKAGVRMETGELSEKTGYGLAGVGRTGITA
jgi:phage gp29-like protein